MGLQERRPSVVTALAGGWHPRADAGQDARHGGGTGPDALAVWGGRVHPGKGGGQGVARGGKGKGILIHSLTAATGMPLATCTTPANGDERAQVLPLLDAVRMRTGTRGRPRKRLKALATDKGYDATDLRQQLRTRGIRAQIPKRVWQTKKSRGRPIQVTVPRFQAERAFAWLQKKYRRLVVRWERLAACFATFLAIATIHLWTQRLIVG